MLQFPQRLRLDLPNPFAGHRKLLANFFERMIRVHADAEAHAEDTLLARGEARQNPRGRLAQIALDRRVDRQDRVLVLEALLGRGSATGPQLAFIGKLPMERRRCHVKTIWPRRRAVVEKHPIKISSLFQRHYHRAGRSQYRRAVVSAATPIGKQ